MTSKQEINDENEKDVDVEESIRLIENQKGYEESTYTSSVPFCLRILVQKIAFTLLVIFLLGGLLQRIYRNKQEIDRISVVPEKDTGEILVIKGSNQSSLAANIVINKNINPNHGLDIFVIGFPKCGTGTIRALFAKSDEIAMLDHENYDLFLEGSSENAISTLESDFQELFDSDKANSTQKRAVKHPHGILDMIAIKRLIQDTNRDTKLILGIRHPIAFYESHCNYHIRKKDEKKRSGMFRKCVDLYFHVTRFDLYMKQLSKVSLTNSEKIEMENYNNLEKQTEMVGQHLETVSNPYQVFIYNLEQMGDENITRSVKLRTDFQEFLQLRNPIKIWPNNKVFHDSVVPEEIDICDEQFDDLREKILANARIASLWIRDKFMKGNQVIVGGHHDHFLNILDSWNIDICP